MTEPQTEYAPYHFQKFTIRPQMIAAIRRYVDEGLYPGGFLTAVICNDLNGAINRADDENLHNLPAFVAYFYNQTPIGCWGSQENMRVWMKMRQGEKS